MEMTERISFQDIPKGFMDGLMKTTFYLKKSGLDLKLLELMYYRVSQINSCAYCLDMHHKELIHMGDTEQRLHALVAWRETPYFSARERAVLAFTEALTRVLQQEIDDTLFEEVAAFFTKAQLADLTLAIAQINTWNRLNKAFRTIPGDYKIGQFDL
jgi:AhpD family alkylhydroperoxidase